MNRRLKKRLVLKKSIKKQCSKFLLTIILLLVGMIFLKQSPSNKRILEEKIYEQSLPFQKIKQKYEKYFGNILSVEKSIKKAEPVFKEKLTFKKIESYKKGAKLLVTSNYLVPLLESGVVVYIGEKESLGHTIIVEQVDGIDTYYSNINSNIKLYDYVEKGELLGEAKDNTLFLTFQKNGEYLDYKEFI